MCLLAFTISNAQSKKRGECKVTLKAGSKSVSRTHKNSTLKSCKGRVKNLKKVSGASYGTFNGKKVKVSKTKKRSTRNKKSRAIKQ
jgi:hypothetical protein